MLHSRCRHPINQQRQPCLRPTATRKRPLQIYSNFQQQQDTRTTVEKYVDLVQKMKDNMVVVSNKPHASSKSALVLFLPGAMMRAEQYRQVCTYITANISSFAPSLSLTVAIPDVEPFSIIGLQATLAADANASTHKELPTPEDLPQRLVQEALQHVVSAHGFEAKTLMGGRYLNAVTAVHSAAGMIFLDAACKVTGGLVLVQACTSGLIGSGKTKPGGWATAKVPIMILNGQEDGQNAWPTYFHDVALSSWVAARRGSTHAASQKPVIVIPGLNHGQMSGVPPSIARGDLHATAPPEQTLAEAGKAVAAFIAANFGTDGAANQNSPGVEHLKTMVMSTLDTYQPYAAANGMAHLKDLWEAGNALDKLSSLADNAGTAVQVPFPVGVGHNTGVHLSSGGVYGSAVYSQVTGQQNPAYAQPWSVGILSHGASNISPELLMHAEKEIANMQVQVLQRAVDEGLLPADVLSRVRVVVNIHPTQDGLLYAQPTITKMPGGVVEVLVQAMIHWPLTDKPGPMDPAALYCASHDYWVKMKGVASVAMEVSTLLALPVPRTDACAGKELTAVELNQRTLDKAWAMVNDATRSRYDKDGAHIVLKPDNMIRQPQSFIINSRLEFKVVEPAQAGADGVKDGSDADANKARTVQVISPVVNPFAATGTVTPPPMDMAEAMPFWGSFYAKVMSQAQAVEWIMQGAARHAAMPPGTPCHWGGHAVPEALQQATPAQKNM